MSNRVSALLLSLLWFAPALGNAEPVSGEQGLAEAATAVVEAKTAESDTVNAGAEAQEDSVAPLQNEGKLPDAYQLVEKTSEEVLKVVIAAEDYVDEDPERYYAQIQQLLDPLIDFRGFSRSVMGPYASSKRYRSLDEAGREQLRNQLDQFTEVMRSSLIRTYSKGLLAFGGSRIEIVPPEEDVTDLERVSVLQHVFADRDDPYEVLYQMGLDNAGIWKLRNVIIEGVNLGEIYRDQFQASAREEEGELYAVIANWTVVTVDVET